MLRITLISHSDETTILQLEGRVADEAVALLAAEGHQRLRETQLLVLDLKGVKFIDEAGLALLQSWSGPRLELRGASSYLRMVLEAEGLKQPPMPETNEDS